MEDEFYGDGQHNGGVYNSGNLNPYIYTYQSPIRYIDPNGKQVDAVDFIPIAGSGRDIYRGIKNGDGLTLAFGVVGLVVDVATLGEGSVVKGGIKGVLKIGVKEVAEQEAKYIVKGGARMTAEEIANSGLKYGKTAYAYRKNLEIFSGILGAGKDAHHIFPKAEKFAEFFAKAGIDVNNPANMKWLEATIHRGKNSSAHLKEWEAVMKDYAKRGIEPTKELLQKEAKRIEKVFK